MKFYPAYLDLRNTSCLVAGGGAVAERKTLSLLEAGAAVTVISPTLTPKLTGLASAGRITHRKKDFAEQDLPGSFLVIAATDSPAVNVRIASACKKLGILVNVAAPPEESTFIVPSVVERGDLLISISTSGTSPALARKIRQEIEECYGREYELILDKLAGLRKQVIEEVQDEQKRREIFQTIIDSDVLELFKQGRVQDATARMLNIAGLTSRQ